MGLLWIVVIIGAIWLIKEIVSRDSNTSNNYRAGVNQKKDTPEEVARKRLARGEISREEFEEIMKSLNDNL